MIRRSYIATVAPLALLAVLGGCGETSSGSTMTVTPTPSPTPTPTPTPTARAASFNVTPCLGQTVPGTTRTVANLVVPDTVTLDLAGTSGFPNGRRLTDPVIDYTLAVLFLRLSANGTTTLSALPLNPAANDVPFRSTFPYLAAAQGAPPLSGTAGTSFNFRTDPESAYSRVDRMGMPAVATALVASSRKNAYNDGSPSDDASATFVPDLSAQLTTLTNALEDDFIGANFTPCATAN